jgi:hypothetical protein
MQCEEFADLAQIQGFTIRQTDRYGKPWWWWN